MSHLSTVKKVSDPDAFSSSNTSSFVRIGELLIDPTTATGNTPFSESRMTTLVNMICGESGNMNTQIKSLKTSVGTTPLTAANLRAKTYNKSNGQSIVVRLGGLDWIVTYVSKDTDNNLVATLWLSNNHQEAWGWNGTGGTTVSDTVGNNQNLGTYYGLVNGGLYSDWAADWSLDDAGSTYPSNMYGTSYIRVETLNNPNNRTYATDSETLTNGTTQSSDHIFSLYTVASKGLTNYLVTPNKMPWINAVQDESLIDFDYTCSNDTLSTTGGNYSSDDYNYTGKTGYGNWGADYLWLPSLVETGTGGYSSASLWETNDDERSIYDESTATFSTNYIGSSQSDNTANIGTWLRSAYYETEDMALFIDEHGYSYGEGDMVECSFAVRPCLLLDLGAAASDTVEGGVGVKITFDKNGGSGGTDYIYMEHGESLPVITPPTRTGYEFWSYFFYTATGRLAELYNSVGIPYSDYKTSPFTENITVKAVWSPIHYKIKYNANGGSGSMSDSSHMYDDEESLNMCGFTRNGYIFKGWATSASGSVVYADQASVVNLSSTDGATVNLYAVWRTVYLIFDNQSATTAGTESIRTGETAALPNITAPTRTGYTFGGYYLFPNGQGTKIYNANGTPAISLSTFAVDTTLYAYWLWYDIKSVTGSTTSYTLYDSVDATMKNTSLTIAPASGHKVASFSFDNTTWHNVDSVKKNLANTSLAAAVIYYANENSNEIVFEFKGISTSSPISFYLQTTAGAYSGLKNSANSVKGVYITSTIGGVVHMVGDDIENLEDDDTITLSADITLEGYGFKHWRTSDGRVLSTAQSVRLKKSLVNDSLIIAVFEPVSSSNVNLEVDNTE